MEVVNYFGPPLVRVTADQAVIEMLNSYADQILSKEVVLKKLNYSEKLAGAIYGGYSVKKGFLREVEDFLIAQGHEYFKKFSITKNENPKLDISGMWIVSQQKGTWGNLHNHTGDISGIIYLKMPAERHEGLPTNYDTNLVPGGISFTDGTHGRFHWSTITLDPKVGEMYLFPSSLSHVIYPFFGPDERRSFSFNIHIYDV